MAGPENAEDGSAGAASEAAMLLPCTISPSPILLTLLRHLKPVRGISPSTSPDFLFLTGPVDFRSDGLRSAEAPVPSDLQESNSDPEKESRNEKNRGYRRAVSWGMDFASFSTPQIKRILRGLNSHDFIDVASSGLTAWFIRMLTLPMKFIQFTVLNLTLFDLKTPVVATLSYIAFSPGEKERFSGGLITVNCTFSVPKGQLHFTASKYIPSILPIDPSLLTRQLGFSHAITGVFCASFTIVNKCDYTVWPGILANAGTAPLSTTGFALQKGESKTLSAPASWSGRLWGRTLCSNNSTGKFSCVTGDCGSGKLECAGNGAEPPATLFEITLNGAGGLDFYDVSLVDGYNLPVLVVANGGTGGNCTATGCLVDLNGACPSQLKVLSADGGESVACKSACDAFGQPKYCCSGAYGSPNTCKPSSYSEFFKTACPRAYSYAYDDKTSTFTCASADYLITFCPSPTPSHKSTGGTNPKVAELPLVNSGMVFMSGQDASSASSILMLQQGSVIAGAVAVMGAIWHLF
ncbi:hypothetical protein HHK36_002960 [Tetracentron sinense]|uniref:Thaumatin-like protein n=1 Tax=Tetracentron sinense TaxID=13715 RepID=A0A835DNV7_TETSI|nr:hypothetical protein HHK36_002960 [Tetracentron sinense]